MPSVLEGVVVLETAEWVAGPYCGKVLADYGADVIKIEPLSGDRSRAAGPFPADAADGARSALFLCLNTGKKSVALDLADEADRANFIRLAASADVVIDDGRLERVGIQFDELRRHNPRLVWVEISAFGRTGPYRGFRMNDYVAYACSGWMAAMGDPDKPPLYPGKDYPFYVAGLHAVFGTVTALLQARRAGSGQRVDVSVLDAAISIDYESTSISYGGAGRHRNGTRISGVAVSLQPCQDGWIVLTANTNAAWRGFCEVIGSPEFAEGRFETPQARIQNVDELETLVRERLKTMTVASVVSGCQARRVAVSPVATTKDLFESEQLRARDWFVEIEHGSTLRLEHPGPAFRLYDTPATVRPAPALGEHTAAVLASAAQESDHG